MAVAGRTARRGGLKLAPPLTINGWLRYDVVARLVSSLPNVDTIIEIGAGMGSVGARLARHHRYVGVEPDAHSFEVAQRRIAETGNGTVLLGDASSLPPTLRADLLCAFEVLEHIDDDAAALRQWGTFLRPGGTILISVPAWQRRYGPSDARVGHYRRYDKVQLLEVLSRAGFRDVRILTYGFPLGYALEASWDVLARRRQDAGSTADRTAQSGRWMQPPAWLGWASRLVSLPFRLIQRGFVLTDLGTGFVALARRPSQ
jgi:SAM-dependent methyltransferase